MSRTVVAVHAHPDDETLTMGGTLAAAVAAGDRVVLITCTLGEQGEVIGDELAGLVAEQADQLGGYRLVELERACRALGISDHRMLGGVGCHRDSGMVDTPSADHPRAFVQALEPGEHRNAAVAELVAVLTELAPQVVLTYDHDGGYGHPDHVTAHRVAVEAAAAAGVPRVLAAVKPAPEFQRAAAELTPRAGLSIPGPGDLGFFVEAADVEVPVAAAAAAARLTALRAHATQVTVLDDTTFTLSNNILQPLLPAEYFRVVAGPSFPPGAVDLFEGL